MTISKISTLVSAPWLRQQILPATQKLSSNLRVIDSSWLPEVNNYKLYQKEHIPTALYFDLNEITPMKENTFHSIPEPKVFKQYVEDLGISNHTHVIVYDNDRINYKPSVRTWFLFRLFGHDNISVLNGGLHQWQKNGYPLTDKEPDVESGDFAPNFRRHLLRDFDAMRENINTKAEQVIDTREAIHYNGGDGSSGHIRGSNNIPYPDLSNQDGTFKSVDDFKTLFDKANIDLNKPLVATCQIAMTACSVAVAAFMLGKEDVSVYNGSFTEWDARAAPENIVASKMKE